ncbi:putative metal transport protein HI_1621 [Candidatus Magnetomoraceae bacterium gMMP-15]
MHISEGVLSGPVLLSNAAIAFAGTAIGLKKLDYDKITKAGMLSAVFFVASLIHVPIGPSSIHLIMSGLIGLLLGWAAFPVILVGLSLQAILFQFGGLTSLGTNTVIMALPAVLCYLIFSPFMRTGKINFLLFSAFGAGCLSIFLSGILAGLFLALTGDGFIAVSKLIILAHLPIMIIEGLITAFCISFLRKVKPEVLEFVYIYNE